MSTSNHASARFVMSVLPSVVLLIVLVSAVMVGVERMPGMLGVVVSFGGGILSGLGALALRAVIRDARSLNWILRAKTPSESARGDGQAIVVDGRIRCSQALIAPVSGERCAAYFFRIGRQRSTVGRSGSRRVFVAAALHAVDFELDAGDRRYPVRALPEVDETLRTVGSGTRHAAAVIPLLATLNDAPLEATHVIETLRLEARQRWTGPVERAARNYTKPPAADARLSVHEERVPIDCPVCILGCYDALGGGLVPGRGRALHLYAGTLEETRARLKKEVREFGIVAAGMLASGVGLLSVPWW